LAVFIGTFSRDFFNTLAIFDSSEPRVSQTIRLFCLSSQLIDKEKRVVAGKNQPPINVKKNAGHLLRPGQPRAPRQADQSRLLVGKDTQPAQN
jgi:hypothetical protein